MRGFLVSFGIHAAGVLGLVVLPSFSASELPPPHKPRRAPPEWRRVVHVHKVAPPILRRQRPPGGGGRELSSNLEPRIAQGPTSTSDEKLRDEILELAGGRGAGEGPPEDSPFPGPGLQPVVAATLEPKRLLRAHVDVQPPRKLAGVNPVYPPLAKTVGAQATVVLECTIGPDGRVGCIRVLRGHPLFDAAAIGAVESWSYAPTLLNGVPVSVLMTVTVEFKLSR